MCPGETVETWREDSDRWAILRRGLCTFSGRPGQSRTSLTTRWRDAHISSACVSPALQSGQRTVMGRTAFSPIQSMIFTHHCNRWTHNKASTAREGFRGGMMYDTKARGIVVSCSKENLTLCVYKWLPTNLCWLLACTSMSALFKQVIHLT